MNGQENRIVNLKHKGMVMKAKYYRHRHNRWVVVLWWNGKQHRRFHYDDRTPLETEALARRIAERINGDIEDKCKNFDPRQWFRSAGYEFYFETYAEKWLDRQSHLAPSYAKDVKRFVNKHWVPFFGKKDIRQIRAGDIQDFRHWLPNHLSEKTKKNIVDALHVLFVDAHNREDILRIPPFPKSQRYDG